MVTYIFKKAKIASWSKQIWLSCPGNKACLFCFDLWCLSDKRSSTEFEPFLRVRGVNEVSKSFRTFNGQIISNIIYILNSTRRRKVSLVNRWSKSWEKSYKKSNLRSAWNISKFWIFLIEIFLHEENFGEQEPFLSWNEFQLTNALTLCGRRIQVQTLL